MREREGTDVFGHVRKSATGRGKDQLVGGNVCAMATVVNPLDDLDSGSLLAVRIFCLSVLISC